jgi:hypothetical protein
MSLGTKALRVLGIEVKIFDFNQSWGVFRLFDFPFFSLDNLSPA